MSSSVRLDLPAPPVPVTPRTGTRLLRDCAWSAIRTFASAVPFSSAVTSRASARHAASVCPVISSIAFGACTEGSRSQRCTISPIIPCRPMRCPSSGL